MRKIFVLLVSALIVFTGGCRKTPAKQKPVTITVSTTASFQEKLAAKEIRRYVYLRTGEMPEIKSADALTFEGGFVVVIGSKEKTLVKSLIAAGNNDLKASVTSLGSQQYHIQSLTDGGDKSILIAGGDQVGVLYGAYRFCELLGVRFFLHGDVIPENIDDLELTSLDLNETAKPLFELRGLNPWGTHPFGFDLWNEDDYKSVFTQLVKMRMNFMGLHCYPEGLPYAEPTVWIGPENDFDDDGNVKFSYPCVYYNTGWTTNWGPMYPKVTSDYSFGGSMLFESDLWGADVLKGYMPQAKTPKASNEVFNRTGQMFHNSFTLAKKLGVKTCIGTEAPLAIPKAVKERLKNQGKDPDTREVKLEIYEGIFKRIMARHPLDYYWIWTSEAWMWEDNSDEDSKNAGNDIQIAHEALKNVEATFGLATAGWVLGPAQDRAGFDKVLPKDIAISAISDDLSHVPIDPAFAQIKGRRKWAIPWMEDDLGIANPQLWVSRARKDAADALGYGCTGLMGLHWRTRITGPNISALAKAGWDQSGWNPKPGSVPTQKDIIVPRNLVADHKITEGAVGGITSNYVDLKVEGTEDDIIYQSSRYSLDGYDFNVTNGNYSVTLQFCEPFFNASGMRTFNISLQGKKVFDKFDVFAEAGSLTALDKKLDVKVTDRTIKLRFEVIKSLPFINGIVIEGEGLVRKVNCGGGKYKDYFGDFTSITPIAWGNPRGGLSSEDFFDDWAVTMFGPVAGLEAAVIFKRLDGSLPRPAANDCPSGILADHRKWNDVKDEYAFVEELERIRTKVKGPGNLERFDYWLNTMRYFRSLAMTQCDLGLLQHVMDDIRAAKDAVKKKTIALEKAVPLYRNLIATYRQAYSYLLASITTNGGLANVINLEHGANFWHRVVRKPYEKLAEILGDEMPDGLQTDKNFTGKPRMFVPTVRTLISADEALKLKVIVLDRQKPKQADLYWRKMGSSDSFAKIPLTHVARGVYNVTLPKTDQDLEYYLQAVTEEETLYFPPAGQIQPQTVIVVE